jgi:hypothetical protein
MRRMRRRRRRGEREAGQNEEKENRIMRSRRGKGEDEVTRDGGGKERRIAEEGEKYKKLKARVERKINNK